MPFRYLEITYLDRSTWRRGPWDLEPDIREWRDTSSGLDCIVSRTPDGILCGYVGIPPEHPAFGLPLLESSVRVHGGITYSSFGHPWYRPVDRCERGDLKWWAGFDTKFVDDIVPDGSVLRIQSPTAVYRGMPYVTAETQKLATALANLPAWEEWRRTADPFADGDDWD